MIIINVLIHLKSYNDEFIPLKKCNVDKKKVPLSPWIIKGLLKIMNKEKRIKLAKNQLLRVKCYTHRSASTGSTGVLSGCYCCDVVLSSDGPPHLTS